MQSFPFAIWNAGQPTPFAPVITGVPTISGDTGLGDTLTATPAPVASYPAPTTVLQWTRDGSDIPGALGTTYTIVEADQPSDIRVRQTSTNSEGFDTATSDATAIPSDVPTNAILDRSSDPILDRSGNYIEVR